ncbi:FAD/NAD(P)-binding protein [Helicobacter pylori]
MLRVAIIGFGARGLGILERLVSKILHHKVNDEIIMTIFDPISEGSGCHNPKQSPLLLANTVASQMSIFADDSVIKNEFFIRGFNFYEFLCYKSYHCSKNGYYSRSILGEYLEYAFDFIQKIAPKNICIRIIKEEALSIEKQNNLYLIKSSNHSFDAHGAFITTGHGLSHTLALEQKIEAITSKDTVIVEGLGLSAIDIFTLLSIGKGGSFKQNKMGDLTYLPSQKEPKILAFSRSNIPLMARAITQKESQEVYQSIHFTSQAIKKIRNQKKQT